MTDRTSMWNTTMICLMMVLIVVSISSCAKHDYTQFTLRENGKNALERCVGECSVGWEKDKECVMLCIEKIYPDKTGDNPCQTNTHIYEQTQRTQRNT